MTSFKTTTVAVRSLNKEIESCKTDVNCKMNRTFYQSSKRAVRVNIGPRLCKYRLKAAKDEAQYLLLQLKQAILLSSVLYSTQTELVYFVRIRYQRTNKKAQIYLKITFP